MVESGHVTERLIKLYA